jgi:hypothetical protein
MRHPFLVALCVLPVLVQAEDLPPSLAPFAAKHTADTATLAQQKDAATQRAKDTYFAALSGVEKAATTAGQVPVVAAVNAERDAVNNRTMPLAFPEALPKTLQTPRKTYLDTMAKIAAAVAAQQQKIDAEYLRQIAALQSRAEATSDLGKALASEKARLLAAATASPGANAPTAAPGAAEAPAAGKNAVANGDLSAVTPTGAPAIWFLGRATTVAEENGNKFLHFESPTGGAPDARFNQNVAVPADVKTMTVRLQARVKKYRRGPSGDAGITVLWRDANGKNLAAAVEAVAMKSKPEWTKLSSAPLKVPAGAKNVLIEGSTTTAAGSFDFDEFEAIFQ